LRAFDGIRQGMGLFLASSERAILINGRSLLGVLSSPASGVRQIAAELGINALPNSRARRGDRSVRGPGAPPVPSAKQCLLGRLRRNSYTQRTCGAGLFVGRLATSP